MKYYRLKHSSLYLSKDGDPQASFIGSDKQFEMLSGNDLLDPEMPLNFRINQHTIFTDSLSQYSVPGIGMLLSREAVVFLKHYRIMRHKFYPVNLFDIHQRAINKEYYWMQCGEYFYNQIDYEFSLFYETNGIRAVGEIKIPNHQWYIDKKKELGWKFDIEVKSLKILPNGSLRELDLFTIYPYEVERLITSNLHFAIIASGLTGFDFELYDRNLDFI